ncbi:MAG: DMT family transporter [Actinomycetota bacterium]|nr:DMT family transporter [Actinomycetota bacterium]MDA3008087.1 DMT family transporter [Actinomycetota bacterium]MDA3033601.1 DMT family transporter [Actinomycetota bacterium]
MSTPTLSPMRRVDLPLAVMAVVVVLFGLGPVLTKLVTAPPLVGALMRFAVSVPILLLLFTARGGRINRRLLRATALPGIAFGTNLIFVFAAVQETTVSVLSTVVANQPAVLLVLAGPLFGERPTTRHVLWTLGGVVGAAVVILGAGDDVRASVLGIVLALLALATFTAYWVLTRSARRDTDVDPIGWMTGVNIWAVVSAVPPVMLFTNGDDWSRFGGLDWLWIVMIALLTGALGHVMMSWVHAYVEAARSSLYMLGMHVVAVGLSWPIHGEPVTVVQAIGGALVLLCVAMVIRIPPRTG